MKPQADRELVEKCLRGDAAAWDALLNRYAGLIWSILRRCNVPTPDAEDLFQNVCLKLYSQLATLKNSEKLAGWLAAVTRQEAAGWARRRRALSEIPESLPDPGPSPEDAALTEERLFLLRTALSQLPEPCRTLLTRLYSEDPPGYAELAGELKIPVGSLGPRRARCLERLKKTLEN